MGLISQFCTKNRLDDLLEKAKKENKRKILLLWNRGLGDIALGLYGLNIRIRMFLPTAEITYLTRKDLEGGFSLLPRTEVVVDPLMKRGEEVKVNETLKRLGLNEEAFEVIVEKPDPTRWLKGQIGRVVPKLIYRKEWDDLAKKYLLEGKKYIGLHIDSETGQFYRYEKNWPKEHWEELLTKEKGPFILFGNQKNRDFSFPHVIDLRGDTSILEMLSVIKNHCKALVAPDSGILSIMYYVKENFPLEIISLWSDPYQGVLKQGVASPNRLLTHVPLIKKGNISKISVRKVQRALARNTTP